MISDDALRHNLKHALRFACSRKKLSTAAVERCCGLAKGRIQGFLSGRGKTLTAGEAGALAEGLQAPWLFQAGGREAQLPVGVVEVGHPTVDTPHQMMGDKIIISFTQGFGYKRDKTLSFALSPQDVAELAAQCAAVTVTAVRRGWQQDIDQRLHKAVRQKLRGLRRGA